VSVLSKCYSTRDDIYGVTQLPTTYVNTMNLKPTEDPVDLKPRSRSFKLKLQLPLKAFCILIRLSAARQQPHFGSQNAFSHLH